MPNSRSPAPTARRSGPAGLSAAEGRLLAAIAKWHQEHRGATVGPAISILAAACGDITKSRCHELLLRIEARGCVRRRSVRAINDSILVTKKGRRAIQS